MSRTVCLATSTVHFPDGGGNLWVPLNWALSLRALGCRVIWLEAVMPRQAGADRLEANIEALERQLARFELTDRVAVASLTDDPLPAALAARAALVEAATDEAELLLNSQYFGQPALIASFRRTALVDIDPGLCQIWLAEGQMKVPPHDVYFSIGETVGTPRARFPDGGIRWQYAPPPVFLPAWPPTPAEPGAPYTTVSGWWADEWVSWNGEVYENNKRASFLACADLPSRASVSLELALCLSAHDGRDRRRLERNGFRIREASEVSATAEQYRAYIQRSRGEWSCAKPSCARLQNAWISDRTLCYLASGKPAVVQHTGPSRMLPDAEGLFRFRTVAEAARALAAVEADYVRHSRLARALAEEHFDGARVVARVLERAL